MSQGADGKKGTDLNCTGVLNVSSVITWMGYDAAHVATANITSPDFLEMEGGI